MKTLRFFLTLTLLSSIIFYACKQQDDVLEKDYSIENAQQLVEDFNAGKLPHEKGTLLNGSVEIVTTSKEIVLFVKKNGNQDLMYILQQNDTQRKKEIRETISSAQVLFFHRNVLINSLDNDTKLVFTIDEELPNNLSNFNFDEVLYGYGMIRKSGIELFYKKIDDFHGIETIYQVRVDRETGKAGIRTDGDGGGYQSAVECGCCHSGTVATVCVDLASGNCDAGGAGSSSCLISTSGGNSCSVSCNDGSSCCNNTANDY